MTPVQQSLSLAQINLIGTDSWCDLISGDVYDDLMATLELKPYQSVWLSNCRY